MATTTKYAFGPEGLILECINPENTPICQALLNKAAAYPPEKMYNRAATLLAAHRCVGLRDALSSFPWEGPRGGSCPPHFKKDFGLAIRRFIRDFLKNPPPPVKCVCPDNQPIYQELIWKSESYPPEKKYNARAYARAAAALAAHPSSLKNNPSEAWSVDGCGYAAQVFMRDTAARLFCPTLLRDNKPLYEYLRRFTATPADVRAAELVASWANRIYLDQYGVLGDYLPGLTRETRARIEDYFVARPQLPY